MKKSEKLFLAINDIKDEIIEKAKPQEEKPIVLKPAPRSPIKEIMILAACIAVLAVGIFAIVKFKTGGDIEPVSNNSTSSSEGDSSNSDDSYFPDPDVDLTFTEEDLALQEILKDLVANAEEIDRMFNIMSIMDKEPDLKIDQYSINGYGEKVDHYTTDYYLITDDVRTEPNGLHSVPQTCEEMEALIHRYFSSKAAETYINQISKGTIIRNSDGTTELKLENDDGFGIFVEADGKMYRDHFDPDLTGTNLGIDVKTAKVISKTDKSIEFSYWGYDYAFDYYVDSGDVYAERRGALVNEDGVWKIHYFYYNGFCPQIPAEYTDQDLELQKILETLEPGYALRVMFAADHGGEGVEYKFKLGNSDYEYSYHDVSSSPELRKKYPQSYDELEEALLKYFDKAAVNFFMSQVCRGTMTANADGTYSVTLDKNINYPVFIEADGRMFQSCTVASGAGSYDYKSAKVTEWTETEILYMVAYQGVGTFERVPQRLVYERGGWRNDPFYQPETEKNPDDPDNGDNSQLPITDTEKDKELRKILEELVPAANEIYRLPAGLEPVGDEYRIKRSDDSALRNYYLVPEGAKTSPNGTFAIPRSYDELKELVLSCFTESAADNFLYNKVSTATLVDSSDGILTIDIDEDPYGYYIRDMVDIDGVLYCQYFNQDYYQYRYLDINPETARYIPNQTGGENVMEFMYNDANYQSHYGVIVYENGGWKLNYFDYGDEFRKVTPEFSDDDKELHKILEKLMPGDELMNNFYGAGSKGYNFVIPAFGLAYEFAAIPEGSFADGREQYPHTTEELQKLLMKYFTKEKVDKYMAGVYKASISKKANGDYTVTLASEMRSRPIVIEADGRLYYAGAGYDKNGPALPDTATIDSQDENTIEFKYHRGVHGNNYEYYGTIKFERGDWRLDADIEYP